MLHQHHPKLGRRHAPHRSAWRVDEVRERLRKVTEPAQESDRVVREDVREGLSAIVSIKHPDPSFSSQTKDKLVSSEVTSIVETMSMSALGILKRTLHRQALWRRPCSRAREAAKKARDMTVERARGRRPARKISRPSVQ